MKRIFEFSDETSHKFWHIELTGTQLIRHYGRIGTNGRKSTKAFTTKQKAQDEHDDLVYEKLEKGYIEYDSAGEPLPTKPLRPRKPNVIDAETALSMIRRNKLVDGISHAGNLDFRGEPLKRPRRNGPTRKQSKRVDLPNFLTAHRVDMTACRWVKEIPYGWNVSELFLNDCSDFTTIGEQFSAYYLDVSNTRIKSLPNDISIDYRINMAGCTELTSLPENLKVTSLNLSNCTSLTELPEGLDVCFLNITGCTGLTSLPKRGNIRLGNLIARGCTGLQKLPSWLTTLSRLNIEGCENIKRLPPKLKVTSCLELAGSSVGSLPRAKRDTPLRWQGVYVDYRTVFQPHRLKSKEIIEESNVERRRVMLERKGFDDFLEEVEAEVLDVDRDTAGGERKLVRVKMKNDEDLVCVAVVCPSTNRQFVLRVPPKTRTCKQGIAWTAGFKDPDDYQIIKET